MIKMMTVASPNAKIETKSEDKEWLTNNPPPPPPTHTHTMSCIFPQKYSSPDQPTEGLLFAVGVV